LRVIEKGLNVTFPAPAPVLWLPMLSVCSMSKLKSSISNSLGCAGEPFDTASEKNFLNNTSSFFSVSTWDSEVRYDPLVFSL